MKMWRRMRYKDTRILLILTDSNLYFLDIVIILNFVDFAIGVVMLIYLIVSVFFGGLL